MKKYLPVAGIIFLSHLSAITAQGLSSTYIDKNDVKGKIHPRAGLFYDAPTSANGYEVPAGSGMTTLSYLGFMFAGIRDSDEVIVANNTFSTFFNEEAVNTGPLTIDGNATTNFLVENAYNKVFKIERADIETFITEYAAGNVTSGAYTVPQSILDWPGSGPAGYSQQLAPYHDYNTNGVYDPMNGDYPVIKGEQAVYVILNTEGIVDPGSMKCEYHIMVYACEPAPSIPNDEFYNQTVFVDYKIINRTDVSYSDMYVGNYIDYDIYNDLTPAAPNDYTGSYPSASAVYGYNASLVNAPVQSVNYLKGPLDANGNPLKMTSYIIPDHGPNSDPTIPGEYYHYLKGLYYNGLPMVHKGNGYDPDTTGDTLTKFIYPGIFDPGHIGTNGIDPGFDWSETRLNPGPPLSNTPGSRTAISGCGPFTLPAFGTVELQIALITTFNNAVTPFNKVLQNYTENQHLNELYENGNLSCTAPFDPLLGTEELTAHRFIIYPNPATDHIMLQFADNMDMEGAGYKILQVSGQEIATGMVGDGRIDITGLAPGIYFIEVLKNNQRTGCMKWIKS